LLAAGEHAALAAVKQIVVNMIRSKKLGSSA
jgi:hypothetical protein